MSLSHFTKSFSPKAFLDDSNLFQMPFGFNDCRFWQSNHSDDVIPLECFNMIQSFKVLTWPYCTVWIYWMPKSWVRCYKCYKWSPVNLDKVPTTDVILVHVPVFSHCLAFPILLNSLILNPTFSTCFHFFSSTLWSFLGNKQLPTWTSWWFQPIWKILLNLEIFPK